MDNKSLLIGLLIGLLVGLGIASWSVNSRYYGMMGAIGMGRTANMMQNLDADDFSNMMGGSLVK